MSKSNPENFLRSLSSELCSQAKRVRDLIGKAHWVSDGRHKESLVAGIIARYTPAGFKVSSGFATHPPDLSKRSRELDVTIIDVRQEQPLFEQVGFSIVATNRLAGLVSVKSQLTKSSFISSVENLASVAVLPMQQRSCFLTGVFFDDDEDCQSQSQLIEKWINEEPELQENIVLLQNFDFLLCTTANLLIRFRKIETDSGFGLRLCFYLCDGMAFANLIAHINEFLCVQTGGVSNFKMFLDANEVSKMIHSVDIS